MKKIPHILLLFFIWSNSKTLSAQDVIPTHTEYLIGSCPYRVTHTEEGDKISYFKNGQWVFIKIYFCRTNTCTEIPTREIQFFLSLRILTIEYCYDNTPLWYELYLASDGSPDWILTNNEEERPRY